MKHSIESYIERNLVLTPERGEDIRVGDVVRWTNEYGVMWVNKVIGFCYNSTYGNDYNKHIHLDTGSYWFPHSPGELTKI